MKYLGIEPKKPKIAIFDFTCCEGCELQLANKEETVADFLQAIEVVNFREISSESSDHYEVALVDGAISRDDEVARLKEIRERANILVTLGTCSSFGGINKLKNAFDLDKANQEVYGEHPRETLPVRAVSEVVPVDLTIPGCPVSKSEVERVVQHLIWDIPFQFPAYPVCFECKQRYITCIFEQGQLCLGPITMGGCNAPCPAGHSNCWGCRGPAADPNYEEFIELSQERGFRRKEINELLNLSGAFEDMR